jgi:hypothetical protein
LTVQDDERERELVRLFNLDWDPTHQRSGTDALLRLTLDGVTREIEVEVKSSTTGTVSTARDVGMDHIAKWRRKLFVVGFYSRDARRPELRSCLVLTPLDLGPWIDEIEAKVGIDHRIAQRAAAGLGLADLHALLGARVAYPLAQAKAVLRQQWSADEYAARADARGEDDMAAFSPAAMLEVLRHRARYIAERGSTLNNPHITRRVLERHIGTDREIGADWAASIRRIAAEWLRGSASASSDVRDAAT